VESVLGSVQLRDSLPRDRVAPEEPKIASPVRMSQEAKDSSKKFLAVLLITILGAFLYSSFAYTVSDSIARKLGMEFFNDHGSPGPVIVSIHSVIFMILIYLILKVLYV
jgi:hypothetical protein